MAPNATTLTATKVKTKARQLLSIRNKDSTTTAFIVQYNERRNEDWFYRSERAIEDVQINLDHHFNPIRAIITMEREQRALAIKRVPPPVLTNLQRKKKQVDELITFNAVVNKQ